MRLSPSQSTCTLVTWMKLLDDSPFVHSRWRERVQKVACAQRLSSSRSAQTRSTRRALPDCSVYFTASLFANACIMTAPVSTFCGRGEQAGRAMHAAALAPARWPPPAPSRPTSACRGTCPVQPRRRARRRRPRRLPWRRGSAAAAVCAGRRRRAGRRTRAAWRRVNAQPAEVAECATVRASRTESQKRLEFERGHLRGAAVSLATAITARDGARHSALSRAAGSATAGPQQGLRLRELLAVICCAATF